MRKAMSKHKELNWYKLDNAAKIYPILTSERFTYVFRVSATLYEDVDKDKLLQAILDARSRFPSFFVKIKRGLFWYYFEENLKEPFLDIESPYVCKKLDDHFNHHYQFQFMYYRNRISLEINHVLTDGGGAIKFLTSIIYHYLELKGKQLVPDDSILQVKDNVDPLELEDGYKDHASSKEIKPPKVPKAYVYKRKLFKKYGSGVINSFIDSASFMKTVKEKNTTVTQYIVALLIYSIIINGNKKALKKHPVNICVPVNLRSVFESKSLNNFSLYFHVTYKMKTEEPDFDDILEKVKEDFKTENTKEKIQSKIDAIYNIQQKFSVRLIPLPIKWILFKAGYYLFGRKPTTVTFSNFGKVQIPISMEEHVESFSFYMGSGQKHAIAMNSYKNKSSIVFSRALIDTDLEKTFFNFLAKNGLDIEIVSNYWENNEHGYKKAR